MKKTLPIVTFALCCAALLAVAFPASARKTVRETAGETDRLYWCRTAHRIAYPVLNALSRGELRRTMPVEQIAGTPSLAEVTHLEAVGRTLCGIAPWLESGEDTGEEGDLRAELTALAVAGLRHAVDPNSPDRLNFSAATRQPLVDAAFLAQAFLRAPTALWGGLDEPTRERFLEKFRSTRDIRPWNNNWLLFSATIEAFFLAIDQSYDPMRIDYAVRQHEAWYKGDGVYGDGPAFHADYYNSFVIQPMLVDILTVMKKKGALEEAHYLPEGDYHKLVLARSTRYAAILERLISPEGTYPAVGRSICYRFGAFQSLAQMALMSALPEEVTPAQVRCALTAVIKRQIEASGTFDEAGWLRLGFCGGQPSMAESYISTGSLYLCSVGLLPLGLPAAAPFWSDPPAPWTQVKAWSGVDLPADKSLSF